MAEQVGSKSPSPYSSPPWWPYHFSLRMRHGGHLGHQGLDTLLKEE